MYPNGAGKPDPKSGLKNFSRLKTALIFAFKNGKRIIIIIIIIIIIEIIIITIMTIKIVDCTDINCCLAIKIKDLNILFSLKALLNSNHYFELIIIVF